MAGQLSVRLKLIQIAADFFLGENLLPFDFIKFGSYINDNQNGTAYLPAHLYTRFGLLTNRNITWFKQLTVQTNRKKESNLKPVLVCR